MIIYLRVGRDAIVIGETGKGKVCLLEGKWSAPKAHQIERDDVKFLGTVEVDIIEERKTSNLVRVKNPDELTKKIADVEQRASVILKEKFDAAAKAATERAAAEKEHLRLLAERDAAFKVRNNRIAEWLAAHPVIGSETHVVVPAELKQSSFTGEYYVHLVTPENTWYASVYKDADRLNRVRVSWDMQADTDWSEEEYWSEFDQEEMLVINDELLESYKAAIKL